jgi:hypothetical protein
VTGILQLILGSSFGGNNLIVVETFGASGTWTCPTGVTEVEYLVIAGGGAGGGSSDGAGGGGGAGGYRTGTGHSVTAGTTYTVTVGAGQQVMAVLDLLHQLQVHQ